MIIYKIRVYRDVIERGNYISKNILVKTFDVTGDVDAWKDSFLRHDIFSLFSCVLSDNNYAFDPSRKDRYTVRLATLNDGKEEPRSPFDPYTATVLLPELFQLRDIMEF